MAASTLRLEDGAELAVQVDGNGRDLLLVSGLGGTAAFWEPVVAPLCERGFRVIRFDQRGIGASTRGSGAVDIDRLAQDSLAVLDHVGSASALLLGHSTGGVILQAMAGAEPSRIAGLGISRSRVRPNPYMGGVVPSRPA